MFILSGLTFSSLDDKCFSEKSHFEEEKLRNFMGLKGRNFYLFLDIIFVFIVVFASSECKQVREEGSALRPPLAEKIPKKLLAHGHTRVDNYYWLKERDNPRVIEYLKEENAYKEALMKHTDSLQEKIYQEIVGRIKQVDISVPYREGGYFYYTRFEEGKEYPIFCRKKASLEEEEEILLNVHEMAEGYAYFHVAGYFLSPNNNLIAFGVDTVSRRQYKLHFKDLKKGEILPDEILNTTGEAVWANDNKTVFYVKIDDTLRPCKVMKHILGKNPAEDEVVFEESDVTFSVDVSHSKSKKFLFIISTSTLSSEYRFLDADMAEGEFKVFHPRERELEYEVEHFQDKFLIRTNFKARNFRLMETPLTETKKENWVEVIPHREEVLLEGFEPFNDFLVLNERIKGLRKFRVISREDKSDYYLDFGEETYMAYIDKNPELDTSFLRYGYSSLTTPHSIFDFEMRKKEKKLLKQEEILGEFNPENYHAERLYAPARDGVEIPISLVYRKGLEKNGSNPLLLYGYGSYGYSSDPSFSSVRLSLLNRGFIYAIAHIRGGQELGRQWYEEGKLLKKKNTFSDFIDCAEFLIKEKFTNPEKLFAIGASAGGLLMGAVANMRPDLFRGIVASVPFVDVVTTMLDPSIPLTTSEYDEWGNPNDKTYYDYMLSYSPYDNVERKDYPAMLVTTGFHDSQVQYWEPAKWVAKLRELKTDGNVLLLHTNLEAGHSGVSGRFKRYREIALEYAFLLDLLGRKE